MTKAVWSDLLECDGIVFHPHGSGFYNPLSGAKHKLNFFILKEYCKNFQSLLYLAAAFTLLTCIL